jgi:hypothetical protein
MPGLLNDQEYAAQFQPGRGVSSKYGAKPPTPDEVAPRGTPEWRAAFNAQDQWRGNNLKAGATAFDLGLRDQKELGKHFFTRMRMGEVDPRARGDWVQANTGPNGSYARGSYRPNDDNFYMTSPDTRLGRPGGPGGGVNAEDSVISEGGQDMWPGAGGQEGSLPQYAAPQYNPVDSWGGWSGVYGNNQNPNVTQSNPAGMASPALQPPASIGQSNSTQTGWSGAKPAGLNFNRTARRRNPTQGGSFGGPGNIQSQGMLIRR